MISTRFQHTLVNEGRALQQTLKNTLAARDSKHPHPDPDRYEAKLRELIENPLDSLLDVRNFLLTWNEYQTKQLNQAKRSRSLSEVMVSHEDRRQELWSHLYRVVDHVNNACNSISTIAWHELAAFFAAQTIKESNEDANTDFLYAYAVSKTRPALENILNLFKEHGVLTPEQIPTLATLANKLNTETEAANAEVARLTMQINMLPVAEPTQTLEVAQLDLNGLNQIEAESVLAKRLKECLQATTIDWAQIKILLQSDFSNQLLSDPVICAGNVMSQQELHAYRQLAQCNALEKPDHYLRAFLQKKWVVTLLQQSPDFMCSELQKQISKVRTDAKTNADSVRFNIQLEEFTWIEQLLGIQAFKTTMSDLMSNKSEVRSAAERHCKHFLQPIREEQLYLDYLTLANNRDFQGANTQQKCFALLLKDVARMAMLRLKLLTTELINEEYYRLLHSAKITGLEDRTIKWLEEMRDYPDDFGGLNISYIQRSLNVDVGLFYDCKSVIDNVKEDMQKYLTRFEKDNNLTFKERFSRQWLKVLSKWQQETITEIETVYKVSQNPQTPSQDNFTAKIAAKARSIIPSIQEEIPPALPNRPASRWQARLKTAALILAGTAFVAGAAAAIVFSLGLATPIVIAVIASAGFLGGVLAFGTEKVVEQCEKRNKAAAVGAAKRAADELPVSTSGGNIHKALGTTTLLARRDQKEEQVTKISTPQTQSALQTVNNPSYELNQNLRYSFQNESFKMQKSHF